MVDSVQVIESDIPGDMTCAEYKKALADPGKESLFKRLWRAVSS